MARLGKEHLGPMSTEGDETKARRERLGMDVKALAKEAGVNRNTLSAIEAGKSFNRTTMTKIERALGELEAEAGFDAPAPQQSGEPEPAQAPTVVIRLGNGAVVVEGPVENLDALIEAAERLRRSAASPENEL